MSSAGDGPFRVHLGQVPPVILPSKRIAEEIDAVRLLVALLDAGADPNARIARRLWFSPTSHNRLWINPAGATPFWRAAQASDVESMRLLLAAGADPDLSTFDETTPLMVSSCRCRGTRSPADPPAQMDGYRLSDHWAQRHDRWKNVPVMLTYTRSAEQQSLCFSWFFRGLIKTLVPRQREKRAE